MNFVKKHKTGIMSGVIVILLAIIAALLLFQPSDGLQKGSLSSETPASDTDPTDFAASINSNIIVEDGEANVRIENSVNNHESCIVTLYDSEDDSVLYESPVVPTGYYIEYAELQEDLPVGQHEGYAVFEILGETEDQVKSTLKIDVDIRVK